MAGAGYKAFADGDVLTAAQVQTFLQDQAVMRFADSSARTSGLGTAVAEGMVSYLQDTDAVEVYDGSAWVSVSGSFTASTAITATDASWSVPTLADPVVRVTVVGGGGGGGGAIGATSGGTSGSAGGSSSFATSAGTATAAGGAAGAGVNSNTSVTGTAGQAGLVSANGGVGAADGFNSRDVSGLDGQGGGITIAYYNLDGISTANVTVGAGGAGGTGGSTGGAGGNGVVIFEYRAG